MFLQYISSVQADPNSRLMAAVNLKNTIKKIQSSNFGAGPKRKTVINTINGDLIDFTHPSESMQTQKRYRSSQQKEDDAATVMVDKKAILREMKMKRKQEELQKLQEEEAKARKQKERMQSLEATLKEQRITIQKKKAMQQYKQARDADKQKLKEAKEGAGKGQDKKDTARQLNELKSWIDEQISLEQNKKTESVQNSFLAPSKTKSSSEGPKSRPQELVNLPGNSSLPMQEKAKLGVRENRYGLRGDNGYGEMVDAQRNKQGLPPRAAYNTAQNVLNFTQTEKSPAKSDHKSEGSVDLQPEKQSKRKIVNQPVKQSHSAPKTQLPGTVDVKAEAQRQLLETRKREAQAVTVIQKWYRGWHDRKYVSKRRAGMKNEIDFEHARFTEEFKINEKFNLNKFIQQKSQLRKQNKTEGLEDSIQEFIYESLAGATDVKTDSYIQSQIGMSSSAIAPGKPAVNNYLKEPKTHFEADPMSLISIYARLHAAPHPAMDSSKSFGSGEQLVPERGERSISGTKRKGFEAVKKSSPTRKPSQKQKKPVGKQTAKKVPVVQDEIEEEIQSEQSDEIITESIPSYVGTSGTQVNIGKEGQSSSAIEESIQESIPAAKQSSLSRSKPVDDEDSIIEESGIKSASISQSRGHDDDDITEESYLKDDFEKASDIDLPKTTAPKAITKTVIPIKPVVTTFSKGKVDRIKEHIEDDYDNDGFESYHGSLQADKLRGMLVKEDKLKQQDYRMSKQAISDFEAQKVGESEKHKRLVQDLKEELERYEKAVSGSIFIEQFQHTVTKSLAQKDTLLLAQRLAQLEQEAKHREEIAAIREEQIKMMSQLMLLSAGGASGGKVSKQVQKQQAEIMHNIQKLIDKPIIIQTEGSIELSQSKVQTSRPKPNIPPIKKIKRDSEDEIEDEIGSQVQASGSEIGESIRESIVESKHSESKALSSARRMMGSEQAVKRAMADDKLQKQTGIFDRDSFGNYTSGKFKQLLSNEGTMMEKFLDQMEAAVTKRCQDEQRQLERQLQSKQISSKVYMEKTKGIEKWVTAEKNEIKQKRAKVKDTCMDIASYLGKIETDKNAMKDLMANRGDTSSRMSYRSDSQDSPSMSKARDQLRDIKEGRVGSTRPETKYLNKKREYVKELIREKQQAIERGVKEKISNFESEMIDEMMQAALQLNVEEEIEKRVEAARKLVDDVQSHISDSLPQSSYRAYQSALTKSTGKKNVKFQQEKFSSSQKESSGSKSLTKGKLTNISESYQQQNDDIGESIKIEESLQQSQKASSKGRKSVPSMSSVSKSRSAAKPAIQSMKDPSVKDDEENSLERDESNYSNDFISESIASGSLDQGSSKQNLHSVKALQDKAAEIEESGYTEDFSQSYAPSASTKKQRPDGQKETIGEVEDEEDNAGDLSSEQVPSEPDSSPKVQQPSNDGSSPAEKSASYVEEPPSPPRDSVMTDAEVTHSTRSVEWQIQLQDRLAAPHADEEVQEEEELGEQSPLEEEEMEEGMEELQSNPSGSLAASKADQSGENFDLRVDQITEELLSQILNDFAQDPNVKLEVEDIDETPFEGRWPWTLDMKVEEPQQTFKPPQASLSPSEVETERQRKEKQAENEAKRKHNELMAKYHREQKQLENQQKQCLEYLDFIIEIVDKEVLQQALQKPIEHDPLKILEKIQAFDTEDEVDMTALAYSQQQSALQPDLFDEIEARFEEVRHAKASQESQLDEQNDSVMTTGTRNAYHLSIFDAFNEALDQERPYKFKGLPNPWSRQTRVTNETLGAAQVEQIIQKARERVIAWSQTGAGTKYAPPPPAPQPQGDFEPMMQQNQVSENEEERNKAERQERLGQLLTREVHEREADWLDYEIEDTQVRFDLADMILEELADEVAQFMLHKGQGSDYGSNDDVESFNM